MLTFVTLELHSSSTKQIKDSTVIYVNKYTVLKTN